MNQLAENCETSPDQSLKVIGKQVDRYIKEFTESKMTSNEMTKTQEQEPLNHIQIPFTPQSPLLTEKTKDV